LLAFVNFYSKLFAERKENCVNFFKFFNHGIILLENFGTKAYLFLEAFWWPWASLKSVWLFLGAFCSFSGTSPNKYQINF